MDLHLNGKTALVSASTEGIGRAIAISLANEGATVYINGRNKEKVQATINELKGTVKGELKEAAFDLSKAEGAEQLIRALPKVDILINNLGIYEVKDFAAITDQDWIRLFEVNVLSGIRLSRHYFPKMLEQDWGRIIFISSESGINIPKEMIHYGMTKSAQLAIARGLAELTFRTKVTVNSVLPGPTYSPGVEKFVDEVAKSQKITKEKAEEQFFKETRPSSLLQRFATTEEVADFVCFVCSEKAAAINGAALRVEGGIIHSIV